MFIFAKLCYLIFRKKKQSADSYTAIKLKIRRIHESQTILEKQLRNFSNVIT